MAWRAAALFLLASPAWSAPTQPCRIAGFQNTVECGLISRPLDPTQADGLYIDVHYVVVPALARDKRPDPVFLFAGGPGQSAIKLMPATMALFARLNNQRDIVFVDQRGTGLSAPLNCPEDDGLDDEMDEAQSLTHIARCRDALQKLPYGKLNAFTTTIAMQDIEAVRAALGVSRFNAVGVSYGTRAVLEYMRQYPTHIRRAVLDSVVPPAMVSALTASTDTQTALDGVLGACSQAPACAQALSAIEQGLGRSAGVAATPRNTGRYLERGAPYANPDARRCAAFGAYAPLFTGDRLGTAGRDRRCCSGKFLTADRARHAKHT